MVGRVEAYSQTLPDTMAKKVAAATPAATNAGLASGSAQAEAAASMAASDTWGGWAVSSLSSTFSGALSLASSSLPIGQQQQQQAISPTVAEGSGSEKSKASATFSEPAASTAATTKNAVSGGGWEFNDDAWGDDAAVGDGWDVNDDDDDGWDSPDAPTKPPAATSPSSHGYSAAPSSGSKSGGMTMSSTQQPLLPSPAASGGAPFVPAASKTSLKLVGSTANKQNPASSNEPIAATATTAPRRKGLGAMKLGGGGASKNTPPPNLDDFF
ncbi:hypothetical protein GGI21_002695 [Coemansia aciculifera]|nr:hypothetical protein GGI21_002695 [Coemansia aciculifera]